MAVKQLSVFLENKKGSLSAIAKDFAEAGIDLKSMTVADTEDFGIARLIVDDADKAQVILSKAGHTAKVREVCGVKIPDSVGGLAKVLAILDDNDINIEYMYSLVTSDKECAHVIARVDNNEKADNALTAAGYELLDF